VILKRKIKKYTIADFQLKLCHATWEPVFDGNEGNKIFNSVLNIFLRICYFSFPLIQVKNKMNENKNNNFLQHKRELYKGLKNNNNNNNPTVKSYYRDYSKIKSMIIKKVQRTEHDKLILNSYNKIKTIWGIINK